MKIFNYNILVYFMYRQPSYNNKIQNYVENFCSNRSIADLKLIIKQIENKIQQQYYSIQSELLAHRDDKKLKEIMLLREQISSMNKFYKNSTNNILSSTQDRYFLYLYKFMTDYNYKYNHDIDGMIKILNIQDETSSTHIQQQYENFINNYYNKLKAKLDNIKMHNNYINIYDEFNKIKQDLLSKDFIKNAITLLHTETDKTRLEEYVCNKLDKYSNQKRTELARQYETIYSYLMCNNYEGIKNFFKVKNYKEIIGALMTFKKDCEDMFKKVRLIKNNYYNNMYTHDTQTNNNCFSRIGNNLIYGIGNNKFN